MIIMSGPFPINRKAKKITEARAFWKCPYPNSICPLPCHTVGSYKTQTNRVIDSRGSDCAGDKLYNVGCINVIVDDSTKRERERY